MIIRGNTITGRLVGNNNSNLVMHDNILHSKGKSAAAQLGYTRGLIFRGNIIQCADETNVGLYVWGKSRYNSQPGEYVVIADNHITSQETAISLNGTLNVRIHGNILNAPRALKQTRSEKIETDLSK